MSKSFREDLTGKRFGRLTVLEFVPNDKPKAYWKCKCDCGSTIIAEGYNIKSGHAASCGCLKRERARESNTTHSLSTTRLHGIWRGMKKRCYNPNSKAYKNYGGRGILICPEWKDDFKAFYEWAIENGYNDKLTIDRIDVNGNYELNNCRWVDMKTQQRNRHNSRMVEYQGKKMSISEAAEVSGIKLNTLQNRYARGDRDERLFRTVKK